MFVSDKLQLSTIPFDRLYTSAILAKLSYFSKKDFFQNCKKYYGHKFISDVLPIKYDDTQLICQKHCQETHDTQVYTWERNRKLYVVFRGTESLQDWFTNVDIRKKSFLDNDDLLVHNGFNGYFRDVEEQLTKYIEPIFNNIHEICFIGHSLGMTSSILAALHYMKFFHEEKHITCYGFGGPKLGGECFASYYASKFPLYNNTWHVQNEEDVIPMVPLSSTFQQIPCNNIILSEKDIKDKQDGQNNQISSLLTTDFTKIVHYHHIDLYIKRLTKFVV